MAKTTASSSSSHSFVTPLIGVGGVAVGTLLGFGIGALAFSGQRSTPPDPNAGLISHADSAAGAWHDSYFQ
ncbi:hypothetical protein FHS85_001428 [Rhodoligotrophos appendicifer]|uniref:hypothetical protein n=1 Tax=Rhodoligotrophos appendicifer TaxID=987056 RepID=UPI001184ECA1|nr:hypothetical protein [Rhodoligotrophos appendicifer]